MDVASVAAAVDMVWVMLAAILVIFMQAGFALLEAGSTRMKNAGHIAGKQVLSFAIAALCFWAFGYAITFGEGNALFGTSGWFLNFAGEQEFPIEIMYLFQMAFVAVSLAIAWGGFAERAKLSVYFIFGALFTIIIYPVVGHWIWGGGWLSELGKQDFAGSTVVHLQGGIAALIATLLLGPRLGKFNKDGSSNMLPGHNQVYTVLGVLIIWVGWFGFNAGSTLGAMDGFFGYVALTTQLAAAAGAIAALVAGRLIVGTFEIPALLNGVLAALVAITAACAFVEPWAAVVIGAIAGSLTAWTSHFFERKGIDDPIYAFSVHGIAGIWGTLSTGFFASPRLVEMTGVGRAGLFYGGGWSQLGIQALGILVVSLYVASASFLILWGLKKTIGLRVSEEEEWNGLDLSEHGSYGYGEQIHYFGLQETATTALTDEKVMQKTS
ncbi:ammonium transporter [Mechercharimyces sp. CAU 1602]|uniref:ammonium transporter n=1 Tax=Mechercharimyces sp. CAU 1602 TaxID=2973933 RepID=UPI002163E153|nr:ammonium transporter [Mechercharimyces sp. CAU 1602]MCS1351199.1 ammonium transporter [Mechercharimyces sp. CAU 1602]